MKKIAFWLVACLAAAGCEPISGSQEDLNSIPEEVENVAPEV